MGLGGMRPTAKKEKTPKEKKPNPEGEKKKGMKTSATASILTSCSNKFIPTPTSRPRERAS